MNLGYLHVEKTQDPMREASLRQRLSIPPDTKKVLVLAESSHWDPDWLQTSEEYFGRYVRRNLDVAVSELQREPRRIYSAECMFFLRMYWERCPAQREAVRALVNEGRLRLTNSGVTTADTLLPSTEAILRDWLIGQEWLRANGMMQEPRLAYFADSFGASPFLPSLLRAAGFDRTALTRLDGMYFVGCDYESAKNFPRKGSSAERLLKQEKTLDFVWRDANGAEVLCHWNAFTYGQGDMLAFRGISRMYIAPLFITDRSDRNVARRIEQFAVQLAPYSRTTYLFCPIGFDFVAPIPDLVALLDRYNERHYTQTGVWAVNAGLDDYQALVECHREKLPVLQMDPNPYWTGFYTSRPALKERCYNLVDRLMLAERLSLLSGNERVAKTLEKGLSEAWWDAVASNHHDFITGTSPDAVVNNEQIPMLEKAIQVADAAVRQLFPSAQSPEVKSAPAMSPEWHGQSGKIEVYTPYYAIELSEVAGGCIVRAWHPKTSELLLAGLSNDLICYQDSGGLWRMGHEFRGGTFKERARTGEQTAKLKVREHDGGLEVVSDTELDGQRINRKAWFRNDSPVITFRVEGRAADGCTVTVRFDTGISATQLTMAQPGGVVVRPMQKVYAPTFWPLQQFVHVQMEEGGRGVAIFQRRPGAVACSQRGVLEAVALRNATRERAFGFLPMLANPATGHERDVYAFDYALLFTSAGDWRENRLPLVAESIIDSPWDPPDEVALRALGASLVTTDRADVRVTAVKPASRGEGVIVRLGAFAAGPVVLTMRGRTIRGAVLCDARECDVSPLEVHEGKARLTMSGTIATVRLQS